MARLRVLAFGLGEVLDLDQHVGHRLRAHVETRAGRFQRLLARIHRRPGRLDLRDAGDHRAVVVERGAHHLAALRLERVLGRVTLVDGLPHPRLDGAAGEDRHVQGQPDGGGAAVVLATAADVLVPAGVLAVADVGGDGGQVAGTRRADVVLGGFHVAALGQQVGVGFQCLLDPGIRVVRGGRLHRQVFTQLLQLAGGLAGDLGQRFAGIVERVFRGDRVGLGRLVIRLGLVHVGDRRKADLEALVGLLVLLAVGVFVGLGVGQLILAGEHAEIGLGDAHVQLLQRGLVQLVLRLGGGVRGLEVGVFAEVQHRLAELGVHAARTGVTELAGVDGLGGIGGIAHQLMVAAVGLLQRQPGRNLRQQMRARLVDVFADGQARGVRLHQHGVVGAGFTVGIQQVFAMTGQ